MENDFLEELKERYFSLKKKADIARKLKEMASTEGYKILCDILKNQINSDFQKLLLCDKDMLLVYRERIFSLNKLLDFVKFIIDDGEKISSELKELEEEYKKELNI